MGFALTVKHKLVGVCLIVTVTQRQLKPSDYSDIYKVSLYLYLKLLYMYMLAVFVYGVLYHTILSNKHLYSSSVRAYI